jgi:hypothetical protein
MQQNTVNGDDASRAPPRGSFLGAHGCVTILGAYTLKRRGRRRAAAEFELKECQHLLRLSLVDVPKRVGERTPYLRITLHVSFLRRS